MANLRRKLRRRRELQQEKFLDRYATKLAYEVEQCPVSVTPVGEPSYRWECAHAHYHENFIAQTVPPSHEDEIKKNAEGDLCRGHLAVFLEAFAPTAAPEADPTANGEGYELCDDDELPTEEPK